MSKRAKRRARGRAAGAVEVLERPAVSIEPVYRAADTSDAVMRKWDARLADPNNDWAWERTPAVARTRDLVANEGWAQAVVDRILAMTVGTNLRYSARAGVMARRLGIKDAAADQLATEIEREWETWSCDPLFRCDWERRLTFGGLINLLTRHKVVDGEGIALMRWNDGDVDPAWDRRTSMMIVDPDRLSNPLRTMDTQTLIQGVETDGRMVVAYHFQDTHPADRTAFGKQLQWKRIEARDADGRPRVLHLRDVTRAGMHRGVSKFVSVLRKFKILQRFTDSEAQAAAVNALFAGVIYSDRKREDVAEDIAIADLEALNKSRTDFYGDNARLSDGSRIPHLYPGDRLEMLTAQRYKESFAAFAAAQLQGVAAGFGISYEQVSMDFSKTNYSSFRGALGETWRTVMGERDTVIDQAARPALVCIIQEGIEAGRINPPPGCPGIMENPAGWTGGRWIGPGRGWVDPVKESDAAGKRMDLGLTTLEDETIEANGGDYEGNFAQRAYEKQQREKFGLNPPEPSGAGGRPKPDLEDDADARPGGAPVPAQND